MMAEMFQLPRMFSPCWKGTGCKTWPQGMGNNWCADAALPQKKDGETLAACGAWARDPASSPGTILHLFQPPYITSSLEP